MLLLYLYGTMELSSKFAVFALCATYLETENFRHGRLCTVFVKF